MIMTTQLSGVAIIIFIAIGFTTFVLLFIFGKRQIMRFALKSRRGPHFPIASDAPKYLRKEIERRLDAVKDIRWDPLLLHEEVPQGSDVLPHVYRMKAVDSLKILEEEIVRVTDESRKRPAGQDVRFYLQRLARDSGPLDGCDPRILNSFIDSYQHARHDPQPYAVNEYKDHVTYLNHLKDVVQSKSRTTDERIRKQAVTTSTTSSDKDKENGNLNRRNVFVINDSHSCQPRVSLSPNDQNRENGSSISGRKVISESAV